MCQQRTAVILLSISIFIMIAAMLILLYTSNVDEKSNNSSKDSVKLPYSSEFCSNARAKCRADPACRVALDYIQIACRYSDHDSVCSKYCQTMVTCLSTNPMASDIFQCSCGPYPLPNERRALNSMPVTPNSLGSQFSSSTQNPSSSSNSQSAWCFPLDVSWCKRDHLTPTNRAICANLATCSPLPRICKANLTIQGCEHVQLERDAEDDCNYLFNETHCSNLCSMDTKTAYQRTKVRALHECICQKYSTPCDLEKSLIVTHCLTRKPNQ